MTYIGKSEVVPAHGMMAYKGSGGKTPFILNLGTGLRCVANITPGCFTSGNVTPVPIEYEIV
jgi:hypothetical protein